MLITSEKKFSDATHKLTNLKIPVYLLPMIVGDRLSVIAALITLTDDMKPVIESVVHIFKKYNHSWEKNSRKYVR